MEKKLIDYKDLCQVCGGSGILTIPQSLIKDLKTRIISDKDLTDKKLDTWICTFVYDLTGNFLQEFDGSTTHLGRNSK